MKAVLFLVVYVIFVLAEATLLEAAIKSGSWAAVALAIVVGLGFSFLMDKILKTLC